MNKENFIRHAKEKDQVWGMINERLQGILKVRGLQKDAGLLQEYELKGEDTLFCKYGTSYYGEYEEESIMFPVNYLWDKNYQKKELKEMQQQERRRLAIEKAEKEKERKEIEDKEIAQYKQLHKKYHNKI